MDEFQIDQETLSEYAQGLGHFMHTAEKFTTSLREATNAINELRNSREHRYLYELRQMREDLSILVKHLERFGVPSLDMYSEKLERIRPLIESKDWPVAVEPDYLLETEEHKKVRAAQILDFVVTEHLHGLRFLDYGCGEGHVVMEANLRDTNFVLGYDIKQQWQDSPLLTTDFTAVMKNGPYDIVLMFDVLDHCQDPVAELIKIRGLLSPRGRLYLRTHPWCSKSGGHLYKTVNKAYIHVLFDEVEQMRLFGVSSEFVHKMTNPRAVYADWIRKGGYRVIQESTLRDKELHPFFANMDNIHIQERIARHWNGLDPRKDLTINSVSYILEPTESHKQIL